MYFHLDRVFLTVVDQRNGLVVSFNAVHRYARLADLRIIGGAHLRDDDMVNSLPIPAAGARLGQVVLKLENKTYLPARCACLCDARRQAQGGSGHPAERRA